MTNKNSLIRFAYAGSMEQSCVGDMVYCRVSKTELRPHTPDLRAQKFRAKTQKQYQGWCNDMPFCTTPELCSARATDQGRAGTSTRKVYLTSHGHPCRRPQLNHVSRPFDTLCWRAASRTSYPQAPCLWAAPNVRRSSQRYWDPDLEKCCSVIMRHASTRGRLTRRRLVVHERSFGCL